jgi:hypothetical protein
MSIWFLKYIGVFHECLREHRLGLSFEDVLLLFGSTLSCDNRWIKLSELIPWNELEDDYAAQFCKGFGVPEKRFRMAGLPENGSSRGSGR